jgi:hypothetical protein
LLGEGGALGDELEERVGYFGLVGRDVEVEVDVLGRGLHGNIARDTDGGASARRLDGRVGKPGSVWCRETSRDGTAKAGGVISGGKASESEESQSRHDE